MDNTLSDGSNRPTACSALAQLRSATQRTQDRRRALIIGCGMLLAAALTVAVVISAESPMPVRPSKSLQTATAMPESDLRTAKIIKDSDGNVCWQQIFDNQTGRTTRSQRPCEAAAYDSNGVPIPLGTIHRLDAISKSFSGH